MPARLTNAPINAASRIENLSEWRHHLLGRPRVGFTATGNSELARLHDELQALPTRRSKTAPPPVARVAVAATLHVPDRPVLSLLFATTVFGTASDITLAELMLKSFFPADKTTQRSS